MKAKGPPAPTRVPFRIRIPRFPNFKLLELTDQFEIESWVRQFPPYSDFNFVSLWSWNTEERLAVSWLNDNLVVRFSDYGTNELFLSFLGDTAVESTVEQLQDLARRLGLPTTLKMIPEVAARQWHGSRHATLTPSPEHDDYVLATADWALLAGKTFRNKRNDINRMVRDFDPIVERIDLARSDVQRAINRTFATWTLQRGKAGLPETTTESLALRRVFSLPFPGDLITFGAFINGEMVGFSINELLPQGYGMGHHWKADGSYPGIYSMMLHKTCAYLHAEGIPLLNIQQDLGSAGLARAKSLYKPVAFLRKYQFAPLASTNVKHTLDRQSDFGEASRNVG